MDSVDEAEKEAIIADESEVVGYNADVETTCSICHAEFLDPEDLKIHLTQVHKIGTTVLRKCHFCPEKYSDLMDYAEHLRDYHIKSLKLCPHCWRIFDDFDAHRNHCKKHILSKSDHLYSCSQCNQRFVDLFLLKKHEFEHKNSSDGAILHDVLPYLSGALKVKSTTFLEALQTDVVYTCVGCDFSSVNMDVYLRHVSSDKCEVFVCHKCCNVFNNKNKLRKHVHSNCDLFGAKTKHRLCPDCNTHIPSRWFAKHKKQCKPIKCYTCDISFSTMNDWSEHQSKVHAAMSVEVETCKYCWKHCVGSVAMQKHIDKTHRPEFHLYKYLCIYCKSVFKHPQKLFGHFLTKHKDIYPYTCKMCDKTFRYRKKFTIHIKLTHKSVGFVEFDENYHVFFTDKKSENPFIPKSIYVDEEKSNEQEEGSANVELNSDFMNATETEGNQTEVEVKKEVKPKLKRKRASKARKDKDAITVESSDDDQPLLAVRKRVRLQAKKRSIAKKSRPNASSKTLLTCNVCNKYCYTVQNYNHHISLHSKHEEKKCIKCAKTFKSKGRLNEHIAVEHSSSRLTETLKSLLEKRKTGGSLTEDLPSSVKFQRTIKRVKTEITPTSAKITAVDHKLSVQKFFENFVPDENKVELPSECTASIKLVTGYPREPAIKMTRFKPHVMSKSLKLSMPVKFVDNFQEKAKVTIKLVEVPCRFEDIQNYYSDNYDEGNDGDRHESIPEVAEEVMLEGTEEAPKPAQSDIGHKIIIPKLPTEVTDIRIAHLLPQAPYYKIVKVKDVLINETGEKNEPKAPPSIKLADGTRLVTTNPLAHLLGNETEKVLESVKNKYYKPKNKNFQGMLAKALTMLDKPTPRRRKKEQIKMNEISDSQ